jgi:serine/threonine protein kinase
MPRFYNIDFPDYHPYLEASSLEFSDAEHFWLVGSQDRQVPWLLFLSIRVTDGPAVFPLVLDFFKKTNVAFKIIKNQHLHMQLNDGMIWAYVDGEKFAQDIRKCITIYPNSIEQIQAIIDGLTKITRPFKGPEIPDAHRIGSLLYIMYNGAQLSPQGQAGAPIEDNHLESIYKRLPFRFSKKFEAIKPQKRLYAGSFIPVRTVLFTLKGYVLKAINARKFAFTWCAIKIGLAYCMEDPFGRNAMTKLKWENDVILDLQDQIDVPKALHFSTKKGYSFLVMEWIDGDILSQLVPTKIQNTTWGRLNTETQSELLHIYIRILDTVSKMHEKGYIHRDITPYNFIITEDGKAYLIDFELTYSLALSLPNPPHLLGTLGYVSPDQRKQNPPSIFEDIYALGALLLFIVTGQDPELFIKEHGENFIQAIDTQTESYIFSELIDKCFSGAEEEKPVTVREIKENITTELMRITGAPERYTPHLQPLQKVNI